jgi:hypothetical protein
MVKFTESVLLSRQSFFNLCRRDTSLFGTAGCGGEDDEDDEDDD